MSERYSSLFFHPLAAGSDCFIAVALLFKAGDERGARALAYRQFFGMNQQSSPQRNS